MMSVRKYKPTGIKIDQRKDPAGYAREYYRRVRRFKKRKEGAKE